MLKVILWKAGGEISSIAQEGTAGTSRVGRGSWKMRPWDGLGFDLGRELLQRAS